MKQVHPCFPNLTDRNSHKKIYNEKEVLINSDPKILFISTYAYDHYEYIFNGYIEGLRNSKINLISYFSEKYFQLDIKPHPLEKNEFNIYNNFKNINVLDNQSDIKNILSNYKLVISYGSTLLYDAVLQSVKVVLYRPKKVAWYPNIFDNQKLFQLSIIFMK